MAKNIKVAMIVAAGKALEYIKKNPNADIEETIKHIMKIIKAEKNMKRAAIAAVNFALKLKEKNPNTSDKKIMQQIMNNMNDILSSAEE